MGRRDDDRPRVSRRLLPLAVAVVALWASRAEASDWIFRRSYFSHVLPPQVAARYPQPESRSAYRRAIPSQNPGIYVQGGYRYNITRIRGAGSGIDTTVRREWWFEYKP